MIPYQFKSNSYQGRDAPTGVPRGGCMAGRLCKIEQTPLSWHRMVSMGVQILAAYLMFLRGFADCGHAINVTLGSEQDPV